jgi:phospholipid-binding lipoprotein MlaA
MTLSGLDTVVERSGTKLQTCAIVFLTIMAAGCAVTEKNPSGDKFAQPSANREHSLAASNNAAPTEDNLDTPSADDDFDLLEDELADQMVEIADPLEPCNRLMFHVNDGLYFWVVKPCALTCERVIPEPVRIGISNFFQNLTTPVRFVNCLLQGKGDSAGTEFNRFVINTTAGVF